MKKRIYQSGMVEKGRKLSFAYVVCLGLLVSNILLAYFALTADTTEKTIVVPAKVTNSFSIRGDEMSPDYLDQMSRYFAGLMLTYQKSIARAQFDIILQYTHPAAYAAMRTKFNVDMDRISRSDIASTFYQKSVHIIKNTAIVGGTLVGFVGQHEVSRREVYYEIGLDFSTGSLLLNAFREMRLTADNKYEYINQDDDVLVNVDGDVLSEGDK